ncbi:MAG: glycosyltransferase [bacterium]|nr:glycosyltransferase [bacterium]
MISTDQKIFEKGSAVSLRQIEYARQYEEVHIIVFADKVFSETPLGSNVWAYPTRSISKWLYVFDAIKLGKFIAKKKGITHITCQDPFETGLVGALVKKDENLEIQIHTDIGSPYFKRFSQLEWIRSLIVPYTLRKADHVRVVSERIKKYITKYVDESKIEIRPIFVDTDKIKNAPISTDLHKKYPQFSKIILMASRLEKEKNIDMAIEAFKIVLTKNPGAGLVIVGSGSQEGYLKDIAKGLPVIFEGWIDDMASYYKTCDCFLVSSWYEGYGMTLVEANAAGCRIVSTDVGVAREMGAKIVGFDSISMAYGIIQSI